MRRRKKKTRRVEKSGVLVPTSGEHYCDSSRENCWQEARWHTHSLLELAIQLLILTDPSSLHHGRTTVQLLALSRVAVQTKCAGTFCISKVRLVLLTRCTDMVQILNSMTALFWTMEWEECVCLGSTRDRISCQSLWASSWAETKHVWYRLSPDIRL